MSYIARVFNVMIASPGDVQEERAAAFDIILKWNDPNSINRQIVLLPIGWEHGSAPLVHKNDGVIPEPQAVINSQVLERSDLLVAIFWTRLGTPTKNAKSGTVEEITRHIEAGKPAMIYFSDAPINPSKIDQRQHKEVDRFRKELQRKGFYYGTFDSLNSFNKKFTQHLDIVLNEQFFLQPASSDESKAETDPANQKKRELDLDKASVEALVNELSDKSRRLLLEAAHDPAGKIHAYTVAAGYFVESNGTQFNTKKEPREEAQWREAIKQLKAHELIDPVGKRGESFLLTDKGYNLAIILRDGPPQPTFEKYSGNWVLDIHDPINRRHYQEALSIEADGSYYVVTLQADGPLKGHIMRRLYFVLKIIQEDRDAVEWQKHQLTEGHPVHSTEKLSFEGNRLIGIDSFSNSLTYTKIGQFEG